MDHQAKPPVRAPRNFAARTARKEDTRRKLVQVAVDLIRKDGYAHLSVDAITLESVEAWITAVEGVYERHPRLIDAMQAALAATRESAEIFDEIAGSYIRALTGALSASERSRMEARLMATYMLVERFLFYRVIRGYPVGGENMRTKLPRIVFDILTGE